MYTLYQETSRARHDASKECTESPIERSTPDLITEGEPAAARQAPNPDRCGG